MRKIICLFVVVLALAGCAHNPGKNSDPVQITGSVSVNGKAIDGVVLTFQPIERGAMATAPVKNGQYKAFVTPGKYTYFLADGSKSPAAFRKLDEKHRRGDLGRNVTISGDMTFDAKFE